MAEAKVKDAKRQVSLEDIKFNKDNALMAAVSCIPLIGLVMFFVERKDLFVRYHATQFGILFIVSLAMGPLAAVPVLNVIIACLSPLLFLALVVLTVVGALKAYKGERYDVPVVSKFALQLMNQF